MAELLFTVDGLNADGELDPGGTATITARVDPPAGDPPASYDVVAAFATNTGLTGTVTVKVAAGAPGEPEVITGSLEDPVPPGVTLTETGAGTFDLAAPA